MKLPFSKHLKELPAELRDQITATAMSRRKPDLVATRESVRNAHRPDAFSEILYSAAFQTRNSTTETRELTAIEELFLAMLNAVNNVPLQDPIFERVQTIHEGTVRYVPMWNYFIRLKGPNVNIRFGDNFFQGVSGLRTNEMNALRDIVLPGWLQSIMKHFDTTRDSFIVWYVWCFLRDNHHSSISDLAVFQTQSGLGQGWFDERLVLMMWQKQGRFLVGNCVTTSLVFAILLLACGVQPWRLGIFTARYPPDTTSPTPTFPSHVFVGVYLDDSWRYLDAVYLRSGWEPAETEADAKGSFKMNIGFLHGCDYHHPFSVEYPNQAVWPNHYSVPVQGVPQLGARPKQLIQSTPWTS